jgi:alpha-tubulin suppressor-like RCC1 family protein
MTTRRLGAALSAGTLLLLAGACAAPDGPSQGWGKGEQVGEAAQALNAICGRRGCNSASANLDIIRPDPASTPSEVWDTQLDQANPDTPQSASAVDIDTGAFGSGQRYSLIQFDLSLLPSGAQLAALNASSVIVNSAYMVLSLGDTAPSGGGTVNVHQVTSAWSQATATWNNAPTWSSTVAESFAIPAGSPAGATLTSIDMTALAQSWASGTPNYGVLLEEPGANATFYDSESGDYFQRPQLTLVYTLRCNSGYQDCNNDETDGCEANLQGDANNCGACGAACPAGDVCQNGACVQPCAAGLTLCGGTCVNESTDPNNCGACGVTCDAPPSSCYAAAGTCSGGRCDYNPLTINTPCPGGLCDGVGNCTPCAAGLSLCGSTCVSETNDPNNCGGCGVVCPSGEVCSGGVCSSAYQAVQIGVGAEFACAVLSNGQVQCWGGMGTGFGELGNGTTGGSTTPVFVSGISNAKAVFAAAFNACALLTDGTVKCWGDNSEGQLGDGTTTNRSTPVSVVGLSNVVSVSGATTPGGNNSFTCAVLATGGVECWGANGFGQLGDGTTSSHSTPAPVQGISNALAVTAGDGFACALLTGGTVSCWGNMYGGTIRYGTTPVAVSGISGAAGISASYDSVCAVMPSGSVYCWGANNQGQLGNGSFTSSASPVQVSGLTNSTAIQGSCGSTAATHCAGTFGGGAVCWGNNNYGQLGDGNTATSDVPVTVTGLTGAVAIASGGGAGTGNGSSCAIVGSGAVVCWGSNVYGQLGNGTQTSSSTFVQVFGL